MWVYNTAEKLATLSEGMQVCFRASLCPAYISASHTIRTVTNIHKNSRSGQIHEYQVDQIFVEQTQKAHDNQID